MSSRSSFLAALAALALVACTATHHKIDLPRDQVAEVLGLDETSFLGMGHHLSFEAIDGKDFGSGPFASFPMEIDLMPGKHVLRCYCITSFGGQRGPSGTVDVELEARAGAVYQARYDFGSQGETNVRITELTKQQAETVRAKEKKSAEDAADTGS
jgi:hypothetical protein